MEFIVTFVRSAYKAIGSGVSAAIPTAILVADKCITLVEWLMIAGAFLAGAGFTYALPANKPAA
jgi:hypothetical protein